MDSDALRQTEQVVGEKSREAVLELEKLPDSPEKKALSDLVISLAERQS